MLKITPTKLNFGELAVNDVPSYCRFRVENKDPSTQLLVHLTTSRGSGIQFQLIGDTLTDDDDDVVVAEHPNVASDIATPSRSVGAVRTADQVGETSFGYSSNLVVGSANKKSNKSASSGGMHTVNPQLFTYNAVFDSVNLIDRVVLGPLEARDVVAIFSADPCHFSNLTVGAPPTMINGLISLKATSLPPSVAPFSFSSPSKDGLAPSLPHSDTVSNISRHDATTGDYSKENVKGRNELSPSPFLPPSVGHETSTVLSSQSTDVASAVPLESLSLPFSVGVFLSMLTVSKTELQATMGPGKTHLIDFSIENPSSRPIPFVIRTQSMPQKNVEFAIYEMEKFEDPKFGRTLVLDSHASMNLSVMVRTTDSASRNYRSVLQCDNLRDARNSVLIYVNVNVTAEYQADLVSVMDSTIDFGPVYRGTRVLRELVITNTSREDVTVRLKESRPRHCEGCVTLAQIVNAGDKSDMKNNNNANKNAGNINSKSAGGQPNEFPTEVDELTIPSQKGAVPITVMYIPSTDQERKSTSKLNFEIEFLMTGSATDVVGVSNSSGNGNASGSRRRQQSVVARCVAMLFTSTIVASQTNINFGDCQVGQSKRYTFSIENPSLLPTTIHVQLRSKIVFIEGIEQRASVTGGRESVEEFSVAPQSSLPLTLRITPQRVNPTYRKQLTIVNASNPADDRLIVNIEANNMAPLEAKLHDELYTFKCKICTERDIPGLRAIVNVPLILPYSMKSRTDNPLTLQINSSSLEIVPFFLDGISDGSKEAEEFEALSTELHRCCRYGGDDEDGPMPLPERAEELRRQLMDALQQHMAPITGFFTLEPHEQRTVYLQILRRLSIGAEVVTKEDSLSIALEGIEGARFVRLSYKLCASRFELSGQKTKNFGEVNIGERKTTKLPIANQSNSMLLMRLSKSRSVTAGHIRMKNSDKKSIYCCIRPFATKEIELSFYPGIKGTFEERISLTNILDPSNEVIMTLKASVTKGETFDVSPDSWSFGLVSVPLMQPTPHPTQSGLDVKASAMGSCSSSHEGVTAPSSVRVGARFKVSNTSNTRRSLRLKRDVVVSSNNTATGGLKGSNEVSLHDRFFNFEGVDVRLKLDVELGRSIAGSSRKLEEKIEKLEQKLKIYQRKNKKDKEEAAIRQIESLKRALMGEEVDLNTGTDTNSASNNNNNNKNSNLQEGGSGNTLSGNGTELGGVGGDNSAVANATSENASNICDSGKSSVAITNSTGKSKNVVTNSSLVSNVSQHTHGGSSSGVDGNNSAAQRQYYELSESEDDMAQTQKSKARVMQHAELLPLLLRDGVPLPEMNSGESVILTLVLTFMRTTESIPASQSGTVTFLLFEAKDTETSRLIPVDITLVRVYGETDQPAEHVSENTSPSFQKGIPSISADALGVVSLTTTATDPNSCNLNQQNLQLRQKQQHFLTGSSSTTIKRSVLPPSPLPAPQLSLITLELSDGLLCMGDLMQYPVAFLRKSVAGESSEFVFNIRSNSDTSIVILDPVRCCALGKSVLDARFKFSPRNGAVRQRDALRISVSCTPRSVGPQRYFIPVKNISHTADVKYMILELNPTVGKDGLLQVSPREVRFADIITPCTKSQLDVQSFEISSRLPLPHALLIRSNRPGQLEFFEDSKCTIALNNPVYPTFISEKLRVYMRFCPSERFKRHTSRVMNAGVIVEAITVIGESSISTSTEVTLDCTPSPLPPLSLPSPTGGPAGGQEQSSSSLLLPTSAMGTGSVANSMTSFGGEGYVVLGQAIIRVSVLLGSGELTVEHTNIDLGTVSTQTRDVRSHVRVSNPSDTFTIRARLVPSLSSTIVEPREIALQPGEEVDMHVSLQLPTPGLLHEHLSLHNISCRQEPISVYISVLKLDESISATLSSSDSGRNDVNTIVLPTAAVVFEDGAFRLHVPVESPALHITNHTTRDLILVAKSAAPLVMGLPQSNLHSPILDETNNSAFSKTSFMAMKSSIPNTTYRGTFASTAQTELVDGTPVTMGMTPTGTNMCPRAPVRLGALHTEAVSWTLTSMPTLKTEDITRLLRHEVLTLDALAQVYVAQVVEEMGFKYCSLLNWKRSLPAVGQCVLLPKFHMSFAMSEGRVDPAQVDLGVVGIKSPNAYTNMDDDKEDLSCTVNTDLPSTSSGNNSVFGGAAEEEQRQQQWVTSKLSRRWMHSDTSEDRKSVAVSFCVTNLSTALPLYLSIECEPTVRFQSNRVTVPPQQTVTLEAFLILKLIRTQGPFRFAVFFVNALNPDNDMLAYVTGQYYWKVFDLSCDGVLDGARESLSMEHLRVEEDTVTSATTIPAILSESKIVVTATESSHVELEVRTTENPKLSGIIELQALQYDAAASLQKIIFGGGRQAGVGVHAIPNTNMTATGNNSTLSGGGVGAVSNNIGSGNANATSIQATPAGVGLATHGLNYTGPGGSTAIGSNPGSITNSNNNSAGPGGSNAMMLSLGAVNGSGVASNAIAANNTNTAGTNNNDSNTVGDVAVTNVTIANNNNNNNNTTSSNTNANAGTDGSVGNSIGNTRPREQQSLRLRCALLRADFAALATAFFAPPSRRHRTPDELCAERSALTFDELSDWYGRRVTASPAMWLGTLSLSNALTGDEEVQVFSSLGPFQTFRFPQRIVLWPGCAIHGTAVDNAEVMSSVATLYSGELIVSNPCTEHPVLLSLTAVTDRSSQPDVVLNCRCINEEKDASGNIYSKSSPHATRSRSHNSCSTTNTTYRGVGPVLDSSSKMPPSQRGGVASVSECESYANESDHSNTDYSNGNNTILFSIPPQCQSRVQVTLHIDPNRTQPPVEQCVALALLDETVPCSAGVVRVTLAHTMAHEDEDHTHDNVTAKSSLAIGATSTSTAAAIVENAIKTTTAAGGAVRAVGTGKASGVLAMTGSKASVPQSHMSYTSGETMAAASQLASALLQTTSRSSSGSLPHSTASAVGTPSTTILEHWQQYHRGGLSSPCVLSLEGNNCNIVTGSPGAYTCSFSFTKDAPPTTDLTIRNNLPDTAVEYSVVVVSQGPQPWLLLPTTSSVLGPLEGQPLRLSLLSTEVGSYLGYVSIFNSILPGEVLLLQLRAEVFVPTAGEGLFEILTSDGQRMSSNSERIVNLGRLFGEDSHSAYVALEFVNRSAVPLEFPTSVVKPFRIEFNNTTCEEDDDTTEDTVTGVDTVQAAPKRENENEKEKGKDEESNLSTLSVKGNEGVVNEDSDNPLPLLNLSNSPNDLRTSKTSTTPASLQSQQRPHHQQLTSQYGSAEKNNVSKPSEGGRPVCDIRLIVYHLQSVPSLRGEKSFVVDPRSRMKVVFLLVCDRLRLPPGLHASGVADVVVKCKQARDARFVFRTVFKIGRPSLKVPRQLFFLPKNDFEVHIPIQNLRSSRELRVTFRTCSPVLDVRNAQAWPSPTTPFSSFSSSASPTVERPDRARDSVSVRVPAGGACALRVRLDTSRLAALINRGVADIATVIPALCEHGFILNERDPSERVGVELWYLLASEDSSEGFAGALQHELQSYTSVKGSGAPGLLVPPSLISPSLMAMTVASTVARPLKVGGQHISAHYLFQFVRRFWAVLSVAAQMVLPEFQRYSAQGGPLLFASMASDQLEQTMNVSAAARTSDSNTLQQPSEFTTATETRDVSAVTLTALFSQEMSTDPLNNNISDSKETHNNRSGSEAKGKNYTTAQVSCSWTALHDLLVDLTWLVEELFFFSILLRNSRVIEAYSAFLTAAVLSHPLMRAWREHKACLPSTRLFAVFGKFVETLERLPCSTLSTN